MWSEVQILSSRLLEILLTNDDGIESPGLKALESALAKLGRVTVVAPESEMSAKSHCITIDQPIKYRMPAPGRYAVVGTPADCIVLAFRRIVPHRKPSIVISGINNGWNAGDEILYSGTVAAATEAALHGIHAIAISTAASETPAFEAAAGIAARLATRVLERGLPADVILNVNYPEEWNGEFRLTRQGRRGSPASEANHPTDYEALASGYVSISPLQINRTAHAHFEHFTEWTETLSLKTRV